MNSYRLATPGTEEQDLDLVILSEMMRGRSILGLADSPNRLSFDLSGDVRLSFSESQGGVHVEVVATTPPKETPPLLVSLGDTPKRVSLKEMQQKLNGLRTLYAMYFLVYSEREDKLAGFLRTNPHGDIEDGLLSDDERLCVESISPGSWNLVVWTKKFKESLWALGSIVGLVYERGRDAFLRKLEAEARIKEAQAAKQEIENELKMVELRMRQTDYVLKITSKLDAGAKQIAQQRLLQAVRELVSADKQDYEAVRVVDKAIRQSI